MPDFPLCQPDIKINNTSGGLGLAWPCYWTSLQVASYVGNTAVVLRLLEVTGVDINYQDREGNTALYLALNKGQCDIVNILGGFIFQFFLVVVLSSFIVYNIHTLHILMFEMFLLMFMFKY